jgi:hypothetical protein
MFVGAQNVIILVPGIMRWLVDFGKKFVDSRYNVDLWTVRPVFLTRLMKFPSTRRPAFDPDRAFVRLVMESAPGQILSDKGKGKGHPITGHEGPKVE